ncbi:MAG: PAS domain S-box protein [Phycisphaerae bacterium]
MDGWSDGHDFREALEALRTRVAQLERARSVRSDRDVTALLAQFTVDHGTIPTFWVAEDGRVIRVNDAACRSLGYSHKELTSMSVHEFDPDFPKEKWAAHWRDLRQRRTLSFESHHRKKDGETFCVEILANFLEFNGQEYNIAFALDMSERQRVEKALRESEERFRLFTSAVTDVIYRYDPSANRYDFLSPSFETQTGYAREEIEADPRAITRRITHPDDAGRVFDEVSAFIANGPTAEPCHTEYRVIRKDGRIIWVEDRKNIEWSPDGKVRRINGVVRDITDRRRTQEALRSVVEGTAGAVGEDFFRSLVRSIASSLAVRCAVVAALTGPEGDRARTLAVWLGDDFADNIEYTLAGTPCENVRDKQFCCYPSGVQRLFAEDQYLRQIGAESYMGTPLFDSRGQVLGVLAVFHDGPMQALSLGESILKIFATRAAAELERKSAEEQLARYRDHLEELVAERTRELEHSRAALIRTERLASIGTLSAGIAHEVNNPIGMILLSAQNAIVAAGQPGGERLLETCLHHIVESAERCGQITRSILQSAKQETTEKWIEEVNGIVQRVVQLTRKYAEKHGGIISVQLAPEVLRIRANPVEIQQALMNVIQNALEAASGAVRIVIATQSTGRGVRISVRDNGPGIPAAHLEHLFDPFFTSRRQHGGTGLGLSIVHGIIADHGGTVEVQSEVGRGTTFTIQLPVAETTEVAHGKSACGR